MTIEVPDLFGAERLSDDALSPLSDNVVLLSYLRDEGLIKRTMSVIKTRASQHDPAIRQFLIGQHGIVLEAPAGQASSEAHRAGVGSID